MDSTPTRSPGAETRTHSGKPKYRNAITTDTDARPPSSAHTTQQQYESYAALSPAAIDSPPPRVQSSPVPGAEPDTTGSESQLARGMRSELARRAVAKVDAANEPVAPNSSGNPPTAPLSESLASPPTAPAAAAGVAAASSIPRSPVSGGYVSLASALPATEFDEPETQAEEIRSPEATLLRRRDSGREALQSEIARLQAELQTTRSPVVNSRFRSSPGTVRSTQAAWLSSPVSSSPLCASPRGSSARDRLRAREQSLRSEISARAHLYCLMLLRALLVHLSLAKGSTILALAMSMPHVRDVLCFACDVLVASAEWILHSSLFGLLPGSSFVRSVLSDPALEAEWMALPEWPQPPVLPWTAGPLRPLFVLASYLPFSSHFFELAPADEGEQHEGIEGSEHVRDPVADGPLVSSLKRARGIEPIVARRAVPAGSSPSASASPVAADPIQASAVSPPSAASSSARSSPLLARLDAQQTLISLLHQDRAELHASMRRLEAQVRLMQLQHQQHQMIPHQSQSASPLGHAGGSLEGVGEFPLASSSLASFIGVAASQRLVALHDENVHLRGLSLAQQAQADQQEREIQAVRREFEALRRSIKRFETQPQSRETSASPEIAASST